MQGEFLMQLYNSDEIQISHALFELKLISKKNHHINSAGKKNHHNMIFALESASSQGFAM